ncbi:unnamed protein product [Heligmosomoides polygyrus]|uniref:Reverse transcriptase domain-containing protein n=1 Tax=Heligmosomoides polygyrus TaxID=6339 RepID=A0A183GSD2_HELPZ|nr:unnamed protein product [Heligmosomoides polygyrus]
MFNVERGSARGYHILEALQRLPRKHHARTRMGRQWGVKVDGRQLHHLRFTDDIVFITASIRQTERMLADFDRDCGNVSAVCVWW